MCHYKFHYCFWTHTDYSLVNRGKPVEMLGIPESLIENINILESADQKVLIEQSITCQIVVCRLLDENWNVHTKDYLLFWVVSLHHSCTAQHYSMLISLRNRVLILIVGRNYSS